MSFTFLHPGSVVEPVKMKKQRRRSPSPGSKPSGSRPVFSSKALGSERKHRSKRTHSGGHRDEGSSRKRALDRGSLGELQLGAFHDKEYLYGCQKLMTR